MASRLFLALPDLTATQDVIESIGMGPAQIAWGILGGGIWLADGAELLLVSAVTRCSAGMGPGLVSVKIGHP